MMKCIYGIINISNGKKYIGSTSNFSRRKSEHLSMLKYNKHHSQYLQNSWNKYGESSFIFIVLEKISPTENLIEKEQEYLDKFKSFDKKYGYNMSKKTEAGGNNSKEIIQLSLQGEIVKIYENSVIAGRELSIKHGSINCCANERFNTYKEYIWIYAENYSTDNASLRLELANRKGHSEETKEKIRIKRSQRKDISKIVLKYDLENNLIEEYESIRMAAKLNNISTEMVSGCCNGKYKLAKGFVWKFK